MILHKCGSCGGCEMESRVAKMVADIDALLLPYLEQATRELFEYRDRYGVESSVAHRKLRATEEYRSRAIGGIARQFGPLIGCHRPWFEVQR